MEVKFDAIEMIREDFPILKRRNRQQPLIYLDNAATTQKPIQVIEAMADYYSGYNANIHRGIYELSERATLLYEGVRKKFKILFMPSRIKKLFLFVGQQKGLI